MSSLSDKINGMSNTKKLIAITLLLLILVSLIILATQQNVRTVTYQQGTLFECNETYINGDIQGDVCPQNNDNQKWMNEQGENLHDMDLELKEN